jgi:hypothetical protein
VEVIDKEAAHAKNLLDEGEFERCFGCRTV